MINQEELLFVVDENNQPIDPKPRSETHLQGYWHRTAHVWIVNTKRQILCHKRSLLKDTGPGNWDPYFGGHLGPAVSYEDGAVGELCEETGLTIDPSDLQFYKIYRDEKHKEFQGIYLYRWDGESSSLVFEKDEVEDLGWYAITEVKRLVRETATWSKSAYVMEMLAWLEDKL